MSGSASGVLLVLSWPAFKYFFFSEAFTYLRIYNANDRHLFRAAFSRLDGMFFRPSFFLADIWWHFVLPPDPMIYHIRNAIFCVVNLVLFHRVLLRFVQSRQARIIAVGLFAVSKMHMTIIGYIVVYEASVLLMTILLAVLFWFRYIENKRTMDYVLTLLFCTFSVFSKDNGLFVIVILVTIVAAIDLKRDELKKAMSYWSLRLAPFAIVSGSYLVLRYILTGPINPDNAIYSPRFSIPVILWQAKGFLATVGNFSLSNPGFMGERGLTGVLADNSKVVEFALCGALWLFILYVCWQARQRWRLLLVPLVWIGLYLFPIFLIRNHQVYYHQEPLVGVALLIGMSLDRAKRSLIISWNIVIVLIAVNGFISNQRSYYYWQGTADRAEAVVKPIVAAHASNPPRAIVFVTTTPEMRDFWLFAIGGPLIPHLLGSPGTAVDVVDSTSQIRSDAQVYYLPQ